MGSKKLTEKGKRVDALMDEENRTQAYLDSAREYVEKDEPLRAWEELQEAERSLLDVLLMRAEGVMKK